MRRKVGYLLVAVWLCWYGVVVPCRLLAVDVLFWRAAFMRDEIISLLLLVVGTVGGLLAWGWSLHKIQSQHGRAPKGRSLT
jgi:hypothetical protein